MRYLKVYENFDNDDDKLRQNFIDITNNYLSFLKDDGLVIGVSRLDYPNANSLPSHIRDDYERSKRFKKFITTIRPHLYVSLQFYPNGKQPVNKTWGEVKDEILSYIEYLNSNYRFRIIPGSLLSEKKTIELNLKDFNDVRTSLKLTIDEIMSTEFDKQLFYGVNIDDCYPTTLRIRLYM